MDLPFFASTRQPTIPFPPVTALRGGVGYDHPLDNYSDAAMAHILVPARPRNLYDAVASAHDARLHFVAATINPAGQCKCPHNVGREPLRRMAARSGNSPDYLGLDWEYPGWRPRRSSYEDRRGAVVVTLAEVCSIPHAVGPPQTFNESENTTAVCPSDEEHLEGLDVHVSDVEDEMDFELASDDTFDASNANAAPSSPLQLSPHSNSVFESEPRDTVRIKCTEVDAKNMNHRERETPCASESTPLLENEKPSRWIRSEAQFSFPAPASDASSAMPTSTLSCARNLSMGNPLYQGGTAEKPSAQKHAPTNAERTEDAAIEQPVIDSPRIATAQSLLSPVRDAPSRTLPNGQEPVSRKNAETGFSVLTRRLQAGVFFGRRSHEAPAISPPPSATVLLFGLRVWVHSPRCS